MRSKSFDGMTCSMAEVLGALGDRWGALIMRDLLIGLRRYDDLRRSMDITHATLSDRLKSLEQAGLIDRRRYRTRPDRYQYAPTARGRDLALLMQALVQIGDKWRCEDGREAPLHFLDANTGARLKLALIDADTEIAQRERKIKIKPGPGSDDAMTWRITRSEEERVTEGR
ncbi:winged helix-turn-helix transcriptional regulator [Brucella intermedia]|uniref:winged helix-turn-helix transcriptional regulator n=1 Tax=Brucella intermedia TaxID=94625 RepID=UPI00224B0CDE|nr:helix-turn-helix domain-containing protein [Brucella intermedia]